MTELEVGDIVVADVLVGYTEQHPGTILSIRPEDDLYTIDVPGHGVIEFTGEQLQVKKETT